MPLIDDREIDPLLANTARHCSSRYPPDLADLLTLVSKTKREVDVERAGFVARRSRK